MSSEVASFPRSSSMITLSPGAIAFSTCTMARKICHLPGNLKEVSSGQHLLAMHAQHTVWRYGMADIS